ncbi:SRPBCC family protein [Methylophaga pinxianii]|uniref:SRPBCC family protein n=1 Tax=Methylophaga pinxianii TaxID=2881052 RepID=UPI001CF13181|nr:SRPBCC family protein [Methylophaga pinxianii]MCB2426593.1 SRPBCC family protein [Methylophaga pinxianii]UPH45510.1 SRPBCC family protein [Methylophaga pinxianii]
MKAAFKGLITGLFLLPALVFAHGASRLQVEETVMIDADAATVWEIVKDFDSLHKWHPAIISTKASGGNEPGATRTLTLKNDSTITETLKKFDDESMSFMYEIDDMSSVGQVDIEGEMHDIPAVPVSKYKAWLTVEPEGEQTKVVWLAKFFRGYTGNHHEPKELNDETATNAIKGIFRSGLDTLKAKAEK